MAQINITEACKLVKLSRTNFYKNYIDKGFVSITRDEKGRPKVDTSELMRVFGGLHIENTGIAHDGHEITLKNTSEINLLRELLKAKDDQLQAAAEREEWLRSKVDEYASTVKLLAPPADKLEPKTKKKWWQR